VTRDGDSPQSTTLSFNDYTRSHSASDGKERPFDGGRTLDENNADSGGVRQTFTVRQAQFMCNLF